MRKSAGKKRAKRAKAVAKTLPAQPVATPTTEESKPAEDEKKTTPTEEIKNPRRRPAGGVQAQPNQVDPQVPIEPVPTQPLGDTKQGSTKQKEKKEGNAVKDDRDLKTTMRPEAEKRTQEETSAVNMNETQCDLVAETGTGGGNPKKKE